MLHRSIRGTIVYTSKKPEMLNQRRGFEDFRFTHHTDGKTTLRAHCCIEEPDPAVMRDIVYSLDEHGKPMDCHVRLTVGDRFMGSGWFRFGPGFVECESYGPSIGRLSQRVELDGPIDGMGTHPVVADGYLLAKLGLEATPGQARTVRVKVPSPDHRGASPPMIAEVNIGVVFLKRETITVAAGTFAARHFQFVDDGASGMAGTHPPYDVWITDDADGVMLQGGVGGYMQTWYELTQLERG
ncbi:hypothetical protein [Phenylobacterium sp.]|uniref:hypothetical protein n=1 Tax=Phenylobacterium sp. TaxID=1871053 RepID=UPI0037C74EB6